MKRKTREKVSHGAQTTSPRKSSKSARKTKALNKDTCSHCGGMLKHDVDFTTCIMCGRDASHVCQTCMNAYARRKAAA